MSEENVETPTNLGERRLTESIAERLSSIIDPTRTDSGFRYGKASDLSYIIAESASLADPEDVSTSFNEQFFARLNALRRRTISMKEVRSIFEKEYYSGEPGRFRVSIVLFIELHKLWRARRIDFPPVNQKQEWLREFIPVLPAWIKLLVPIPKLPRIDPATVDWANGCSRAVSGARFQTAPHFHARPPVIAGCQSPCAIKCVRCSKIAPGSRKKASAKKHCSNSTRRRELVPMASPNLVQEI